MPRIPRHRQAKGMLAPGAMYHINNRGVNRCPIFRDSVDRLVFLLLLAATCCAKGLVVHCYCLMGSHYHLVVEDRKGQLSQAMQAIQGIYAMYFNRKYGRSGHLFQGRFHSKMVKTASYYRRLCAYVLANPVRAGLVETAEAYPWSSVALALDSTLTSGALCERMLARASAALLASGNDRARKRTEYLIDVFRSGTWLDSSCVRAGRTPEQYREELLQAAGEGLPEETKEEVEAVELAARAERAGVQSPRVCAAFKGLNGAKVSERIEQASLQMVPALAGIASRLDVVRYLQWRFLGGTLREVGKVVRTSADAVARSLQCVRAKRASDPAWDPLLWRVEWRLRWVLGAGPWRE